ncbi:MAG TPA: flavin reductase family protein [bacterium]|nr:flavin reductase family protein [bacterium]
MQIDPGELNPIEAYKLMISVIVPRPIAFISTCAPDGTANLAPFSFFNGVSSHPPIVSVAIGLKRGGIPKDTLRNIRETGEFVVNMVTEPIAEAMHQASADYPQGISEFEQVGLTPVPSAAVKAPRVKESPISMECRLVQLVSVPDAATELVLGRVVRYHVADSIISDLTVDIEDYPVVGRLGGRAYCTIGSTFTMPRAEVPAEILEQAQRLAGTSPQGPPSA